jgi:hypothetical protein
VEAALKLCDTCRDSVARAKIAVSEIHQTLDRARETRRRTEEIRAKARGDPEQPPLLDNLDTPT